MNKSRMTYFQEEDVLHLLITEGEEWNSVELSPNITAELDANGELIGIEILNASSFIRDSILEGINAKLLNLSSSESLGGSEPEGADIEDAPE